MSRIGFVQTAHVGLEAIEEDVARLAGGQYRAGLEVGSLNFALMGEREQEAIVAGFAGFLNSLSFPAQVLVRVLPIDVDGYLAGLERQARQLPEGLAELARDHAAFLRQLARRRTLLERRFYLVVPAQAGAGPGQRGWPFGRRATEVGADAARRQLTFRCDEIERQLARCGLAVRRLSGLEIAQLFYACWCPELARVQRLGRELAQYTALVVRAGRGRGGSDRARQPDRGPGERST